jgi:hypothetical protein
MDAELYERLDEMLFDYAFASRRAAELEMQGYRGCQQHSDTVGEAYTYKQLILEDVVKAIQAAYQLGLRDATASTPPAPPVPLKRGPGRPPKNSSHTAKEAL